jgi:hypothetical protein
MTSNSITLSQFLDIKKQVADKGKELLNSQQFENLKQKIAQEKEGVKLAGSFYENIFMLMLDKLDDLLTIDIPKDVFAAAWSKHKDLLEYRDSEQYPPEVTFLVPLVEHSLKTEHTPSIEPSLAGKPLGKLELEVEVEFLIKGAILEVRDAKIMKIRLSTIQGTGTLGFAGISFLEKENSLELPGILDLGEGVAIREPFERGDSAKAVENPGIQDKALEGKPRAS